MPHLTDDGRTVTLDLHGTRLDDAEHLLLRAVSLAAKRGRDQVKVIHGASTSSTLYRNRTVRHALHDLLDDGALDQWVTDDVRFEGHTLLSLSLHASRDPSRLTLRDLNS